MSHISMGMTEAPESDEILAQLFMRCSLCLKHRGLASLPLVELWPFFSTGSCGCVEHPSNRTSSAMSSPTSILPSGDE